MKMLLKEEAESQNFTNSLTIQEKIIDVSQNQDLTHVNAVEIYHYSIKFLSIFFIEKNFLPYQYYSAFNSKKL